MPSEDGPTSSRSRHDEPLLDGPDPKAHVSDRPRREDPILSGPRLGLAVVLATSAFTALVYARIPAEIPPLIARETTNTIDRWPGALAGPALAAVLWTALRVLVTFDPTPEENRRFTENLWRIVNIMILLIATLHTFTLGAALGWPLDGGDFLLVAVGTLLLVFAEYLPRTRARALVAIRTPWTLRSDDVWTRTHQIAGRALRIGGILTLCGILAPPEWRPTLGLLGITIGGFVPVVYSYIAWRREARRKNA